MLKSMLDKTTFKKHIENELAHVLTRCEQGSYEKNLETAKLYLHSFALKAQEEERDRILLWIFENMVAEGDEYWDEDFETWKDLSWIASEITPLPD